MIKHMHLLHQSFPLRKTSMRKIFILINIIEENQRKKNMSLSRNSFWQIFKFDKKLQFENCFNQQRKDFAFDQVQ